MTAHAPAFSVEEAKRLQRRTFLCQAGRGAGLAALASLIGGSATIGAPAKPGGLPALSGLPHFAARAKRVIWLCMAGGPSHLETFDHKPKLAELHGRPMPDSFTSGQPIAQLQGKTLKCLGPMFPFRRFGRCGTEMSELFPHLGNVADELCVIRSMRTEAINHDPAHTFMNTGTTVSGRPSMGSWVTYGLGSAASDLPGFIVLTSQGEGRSPQPIASRQWHSGFLPGKYQGVHFRGKGDPVSYLSRPEGVTANRQRDVVDAVNRLNTLRQGVLDDPEIAARITQYELAFAMQASVPELMNLGTETQATLDMYGTRGADGSFAANCLLARRLIERGVRFVQLYHRDWDHHNGLRTFLPGKAKEVDRASAALITDLKQRGLLDDTLVVWGGEFGRTPMAQTDKGDAGRDHHMQGFSMWLAGGGIRGGMTYGNTDELGYAATENVVHVHDLHATMLHLLGIDHRRLTFKFQGRDFRLTDVHGQVVRPIIA